MKAAILQCDDVLEKFQEVFGNYPAMIERMFDQNEEKIIFDTYDCQKGALPPDINAYDFYITTGSKASVYDGLAWVDDLVRFIQTLDKHKKKLIGICFGHELIAVALDVAVEKSDKGWGIGMASNQMISHPAWMQEKPKELNILVSHQDQIVELTDDAMVIAGSDFCPYFMVQWNEHFLSIQGHPEWSNDYSYTLMNDRRSIIPADTIEQGIDSLTTPPDNKMIGGWIIRFVKQKTTC